MVDRKLGRGLDFFLSGTRQTVPQPAPAPVAPANLPEQPPAEETRMIAVDLLSPSPFQPRRDVETAELSTLADSIRASGVLQPILARRAGERFEIVAGERRWRAAKLAGLDRVPVLIRKISDDESAVFGLVENIQREDLNAIDKAKGFQALIKKLGTTQEEIAKKVGLDRSSVANFLRLLELPEGVQAHVSRGTLSMGHARTLLAMVDKDSILKVAEESIRQAWSVRVLEQHVKDLNQALVQPASAKPAPAKKGRPVWLNELEEGLVETLSTPVTIRYSKKKSTIQIECNGREEFERILARLRKA